ncbi:hypothetical protein DFP72DRAFT_1040946 [Ephemerocybe angulata]|uniref:Uncharacterized protein n=1 Tax=Ephemerocybe angulata TaxID=980116 RepID=A0A8H6IFM0_9AGAR|nr:hypothetical protein DFP72DRAFT_1040946 [Tulosesus angulatus]
MIRVMISCCGVDSRTGHEYEDDAPGIWDERSINPQASSPKVELLTSDEVFQQAAAKATKTTSPVGTERMITAGEQGSGPRAARFAWTCEQSQVIRERYHLPVPCISRVRPTTKARHVPVYIHAAGTAPDSRPRPTRWRGQLGTREEQRMGPTFKPSPSEKKEFATLEKANPGRSDTKILSESVHEFDGELSEGPRSSRDYSWGHEALDAHDFPAKSWYIEEATALDGDYTAVR